MKKMTKLAFSMAVASCALFAAVTANASAPVSLEYDETNSTSKTAYVSLKTTDAEISSYEMYLATDANEIASFKVIAAMDGFKQNITDSAMAGMALDGGVLKILSTDNLSNGIVLDGGVVYTLELTFAEELTEDVTISWQDYSYVETNVDWYDSETYKVSCVALANPNAGGTGGDDDEDDTTPYVPEVLEATRFDAHTNTVPVDAWSTTIDYSTTAVEGKLTWNIFNGVKTAKVEAATVTGQPTVVYGLFIAGQAAELNTIESVQLIAE